MLQQLHLLWQPGCSIPISEGKNFRLGARALTNPNRPLLVTLDQVRGSDLLQATVRAPGVSFWVSTSLNRGVSLLKLEDLVEAVDVAKQYREFDVVLVCNRADAKDQEANGISVVVTLDRVSEQTGRQFFLDPVAIRRQWSQGVTLAEQS